MQATIIPREAVRATHAVHEPERLRDRKVQLRRTSKFGLREISTIMIGVKARMGKEKEHTWETNASSEWSRNTICMKQVSRPFGREESG